MRYLLFSGLLAALLLSACGPEKARSLPILGERDVVNGDTIYPSIPDFLFIDQDSQQVTNAS
ncbi:MAG TPA: SCO family protein, partial [Saprospiraceae bacterium]|nr:SCO family protein [Saprospiraceae bacterium]